MNRMITSLLLLIGMMIAVSNVSAQQAPKFDSLKIIPENPNPGDEIRLICYATFPTGNCQLDNQVMNVSGTTISLSLHYKVGDYQAFCHSTDTLNIGMLNEGNYTLIAYMNINLLEAVFDADTMAFTVGKGLGIPDIGFENSITIYPNPFSRKLKVTTGPVEGEFQLEIYALPGNRVFRQPIKGDTEVSLARLPDGVYIAVLTGKDGELFRKKIVKYTW